MKQFERNEDKSNKELLSMYQQAIIIFANSILKRIEEKIQENIKKNQNLPIKENVELFTRKETSLRLKISLPTLHSYTTKGLIKASRIGSRVLYSSKDIEEALIAIRYGKK